MAVPTGVITHGVSDCSIFPITADSSTAYTVGTGIDLPIISIDYSFEMDEKELRQDNTTSDIYTESRKIPIKLTSGTLSFDAAKALFGGTLASSGTTPNQVQTYSYALGKVDNYVQLGVKIDYTGTLSGAADMHLYFMKCKVSNWQFNTSDGEYGQVSIDMTGINPTKLFTSAKKGLVYQAHETDTALTAIIA